MRSHYKGRIEHWWMMRHWRRRRMMMHRWRGCWNFSGQTISCLVRQRWYIRSWRLHPHQRQWLVTHRQLNRLANFLVHKIVDDPTKIAEDCRCLLKKHKIIVKNEGKQRKEDVLKTETGKRRKMKY